MADYAILYPGRFLKKEELERPTVIRIVEVKRRDLANENKKPGDKPAKPDRKTILHYKAAPTENRPDGVGEIVLCQTNAALIAAALGDCQGNDLVPQRDTDKWADKLITIYSCPDVWFGRDKVGGIRVFGSPQMVKPLTVKVPRPRRGDPDVYKLVPTDGKGNTKGSKQAPQPKTETEQPERQAGEEG